MSTLGGGGLVLSGSTEDMVEQYLFSLVLYSQDWWWGGKFVLMVMVVERGDATTGT
jgi:hypothetical protein